MTKPWEETWTAQGNLVDSDDNIGEFYGDDAHAQARLASAAPELVRALLAVEWEGDEPHEMWAVCSCCRGINPWHARRWTLDGETEALVDHRIGCSLDAALDAAGLPRTSRADARTQLGLTSPRPGELRKARVR